MQVVVFKVICLICPTIMQTGPRVRRHKKSQTMENKDPGLIDDDPEFDGEGGPARPYMRDRRRRSYELRRAILDYGMGVIIFGFGVFFLFAPKFGVQIGIDNTFRYIFSGLCLLYGGFRVYRGSRKNYFN